MDIYDEAVREWIARRLRSRGHGDITRDKVRNVRMGIDEGFPGSDVTPGDNPEAAIACEIRTYDHKIGWWTDDDGWMEHHEHVFSVPSLIRECAVIVDELRGSAERPPRRWPFPARSLTLTIHDVEPMKIQAIKHIRAATGFGLKESKEATEGRNLTLARKPAEALAEKLRGIGVTVTVRRA